MSSRERGNENHIPRPTVSYIVCGSQRAGTSLLCALLESSQLAGEPWEYFYEGNEELYRQEWGVSSDLEYVAEVLRHGTTPNGVFGAKLMWSDLDRLLAKLRGLSDDAATTEPELIERWFPNTRYLWIWREDAIAQAVSWAKALQTDQWVSWRPGKPEPLVFDPARIEACHDWAVSARAGWRDWFERQGIVPLGLSYEELVRDPAGNARRGLAHIGVSVSSAVALDAGLYERQADETNQDWITRYRRLHAGAGSGDRTDQVASPPERETPPRRRPADVETHEHPHVTQPLAACTVITLSRLAHARVLARSFAKHHPGSTLTALVLDDLDRTLVDGAEPFEVVRSEDLDLERREFHRMALMYSPLELCCAMKPWAIRHLLSRGAPSVLYLDSDIEVFAPLVELAELARHHSLVLTPHLTTPPPRRRDVHDEDGRLQGGAFNAGFLAVGQDGVRFLEWWQARMARDCLLLPTHGYFVDQRWLDLVPGYFDLHVARDPACNTAFWNVSSARVEGSGERYLVDGHPLRFFHFAALEPEHPHILSKWLRPKPHVLLSERPALAELASRYADALIEEGYELCSRHPYGFAALPSGMPVDGYMRWLYREATLESEDSDHPEPPNPFEPGETNQFIRWLREPDDRRGRAAEVPRYLRGIWRGQAELRARFPDLLGADAERYLTWMRAEGSRRYGAPWGLLRPASPTGSSARSGLDWPAALEPGLTVVHSPDGGRPLDEAARRLVECCREGGIPVSTIGYSEPEGLPRDPFLDVNADAVRFDTLLVCLSPDELPRFCYFTPGRLFAERRVAALWLDVDAHPESLTTSASYLDEVWAGSEQVAAEIQSLTDKPVQVLPLPASSGTGAQNAGGEQAGEFAFLAVVDLAQGIERANPLGVIRAFERAFPGGGGPTLTVVAAAPEDDLVDLEELRLASARPDVRVVANSLPAGERRALLEASDAYVSLARAGGFGLDLTDAIALGKPAVVTGFPGVAPDEGCSQVHLVRCSPGPPASNRHAGWAEPAVYHAAELLRRVYTTAREGKRADDDEATAAAEAFRRATIAFLHDRVANMEKGATLPDASEASEAAGAEPAPSVPPRSSSARGSEASEAAGAEPAVSPELERARAILHAGPENRWDGASRFGLPGKLARRLLLRCLRPYLVRRRELDEALLDAIAGSARPSVPADAAAIEARPVQEPGQAARDSEVRGSPRPVSPRVDLPAAAGSVPARLAAFDVAPTYSADELEALGELHSSSQIAGMTSSQERAYCQWHAQHVFTGIGEIVDLGCWLGSFTTAVAMGLEANGSLLVRGRRIHAYDTFVWLPWMDASPATRAVPTRPRPGESFLPLFEEQVSGWQDLVEVHEGDLRLLGWDGGPIEFLIVDAMKSWELTNSIARQFFPRLLPGIGFVLHQDFAHDKEPWIHLLMYRLRDRFELAHDIAYKGSGVVFRLVSPLSLDDIPCGLSWLSFSADEVEAAFDYWLARVAADKQPNVAAAKITALVSIGERERARRELDEWQARAPDHGNLLADAEETYASRWGSE